MKDNILQEDINKKIQEIRPNFKEKKKEKISVMMVLSVAIALAAILGLLIRFL